MHYAAFGTRPYYFKPLGHYGMPPMPRRGADSRERPFRDFMRARRAPQAGAKSAAASGSAYMRQYFSARSRAEIEQLYDAFRAGRRRLTRPRDTALIRATCASISRCRDALRADAHAFECRRRSRVDNTISRRVTPPHELPARDSKSSCNFSRLQLGRRSPLRHDDSQLPSLATLL